MVAALVLAVLTAGATPTPLPIIITTKSSPVCAILREKIAPAISRLVEEDRLMSQQRPLYTSYATVLVLADNWIKVNELLNADTFFHSSDPVETARMNALRERLQAVADRENAALNILSGAAETAAYELLMAKGTKSYAALGERLAQIDGTPVILQYMGPLDREFVQREVETQRAELLVGPALAPIVAACK